MTEAAHPRILVWQWGRRGAGPRYAAELAASLRDVGAPVLLSLSAAAELLEVDPAPPCDLRMQTYRSVRGYLLRWLALPVLVPRLARWLRRQHVDAAVCAMPAALDLVMAVALRLARIPYAVVVHEVDLHPGDRFAAQLRLQRWLLRSAAATFALSGHVMGRIRAQGMDRGNPLTQVSLPPFRYGPAPPPPGAHDGPMRLLSFGRLLPYKGLDLLADALALVPPGTEFLLRVVGSGPDGPELQRLRALGTVRVENRWVAEDEIAALLGWADALVLSHREASQSGVAASALAAGRWVIATEVGGLAEQLRNENAAILCAPDPESLAAAIGRLAAVYPAAPAGASAADTAWTESAHRMLERLSAIARRPRAHRRPGRYRRGNT